MKIIYDYRIFSKQRHGGISRYFVELAQQSGAIDGAQARILAPLYVNHYLRALPAAFHSGIYLKKSPSFSQSFVESTNFLLSKIDLKLFPPNILHETYYGERGLVRAGIKTVTTVYDLIHAKFPDLYPGDETPRLQAAAVRRADHIFCISRKTQEDLIEILGVDESRTSVTHLGCDFQNRKSEVRGRPLPFPYFLFVGPRGKHKNFRILVEAFAGSSRLTKDFKIVCFGSTSFLNEELEQMRSLGLSSEQVLHVTGEDNLLPSYYAHAHIFVYPSLYEGFGLPPLEAMSLGCPTVCSDAGSMPEILGKATEFFPSGNIEGLRQALENVAYSSDRRTDLSRSGLEKSAEYTWNKCAKTTFATYRKIIGN